jgi:membrane dipeptidase
MKNIERPFIVDAHLDLAMNAMEWNRDLRWGIHEIRKDEIGLADKADRGNNTVNFKSLRDGNIGLVVATQIARYARRNQKMPGASWNSPEQAWAQTQAQLAWYKAMEKEGHITQITNKTELQKHLNLWQSIDRTNPIGFILSLEGADSIVDMNYLETAYAYGLRAIGPAHYGPGIYAFGTDSDGGIGERGKELLSHMEKLDMILDTTHLCDQSFWEALDHFKGHVWASHSNCRALVPHHRQFSDEQLKALKERDAVIGTAFDAWMLTPNWVRGKSDPKSMDVTLENVVNQIDHICQLAGNTLHAGIGSDLDGGFGKEQCPNDVETISDLQKIPSILKERGYSQSDIGNITSGNWIRFLEKALPE